MRTMQFDNLIARYYGTPSRRNKVIYQGVYLRLAQRFRL